MINYRAVLMIVIISVITMMLRIIPFLIFEKRKTPEFVVYLGKVLPYAIMGMLVVYCLRGTSFVTNPYGIPEIVSVLIVVLVHIWKRNTLLSILTGTLSYMMFVQFVF
ncbi:MAG: branched-chain amino acid transporter AzlD [Ruminococcaceae bacterium]|nr:branched-chain amino acid transporter AzlD [Oscillospiraceae bacterium]